MAPPSSNPFETPGEELENLTPVKPCYRPCSNLTLPLANLEPISRTTTAAGTPLAPEDPETPSTAHPFSAFYSHPQCAVSSETKSRLSLGTRPSMSKESSHTGAWDQDVEAAVPPLPKGRPSLGKSLTPAASARPSFEPSLTKTPTQMSGYPPSKLQKSTSNIDKDQSYCTVWPAGSEVRLRKERARRMKGCLLFRNLSRKQKIIAKIALGVLILGIATIIGVVISYKTGGAVWKSANNYGAIGS